MSPSTAWIYLFIAGIMEIAWATGLKFTQGFSRPLPTAGVLLAMVISVYCLSQAVKVLPLGTAYAVWTGIGAAGTAILGILFFHEPAQFFRLASIFLIITGTIGLKFITH